MSTSRLPFLLLTMLLLVVGCSGGDDPAAPGESARSLTALLRGELADDTPDFEMSAKVGDGMGDPATLVVRGRDMEYDDAMGALKIDLSVYNDSDEELPKPVGLTFMQFMPEGVTVLNPDNDQNGPGAMIRFEFEEEDMTWSPGEESLPRTVYFGVDAGASFGFVGRIDIGLDAMGGAIGGLVWNDADGDGEIGDGEMGVGGMTVTLYAGADSTGMAVDRAMTAEDGTYRFSGQPAGYYTVVLEPTEGYRGTTPPYMAVILVEMDGTVSDFLMANFGVTEDMMMEDWVRVGDYIKARGDYMEDPDRLDSYNLKVSRCDGDKHDDDGCRQNDCWGRLNGPITGHDFEERYLEIMGTPVYYHQGKTGDHDWDWDWDDLFRVRLDVTMDDEDRVRACKHPKKAKRYDEVRGYVQEVVHDDAGEITAVKVLNTMVTVPADHDPCYDDCDDDDDDDDDEDDDDEGDD